MLFLCPQVAGEVVSFEMEEEIVLFLGWVDEIEKALVLVRLTRPCRYPLVMIAECLF